jgi:hypothetical protein
MLVIGVLPLLVALAALSPVRAPAAGSGPCFQLDGQSYCYAWSTKDASMAKTEFLRAGESVNRWQNMVTILRYDEIHTLDGARTRYMAAVRPYLGPDANPQWVTSRHPVHAGEAATRLLLASLDGSDTEYVVVYFFSDPGKPAYAITFSQRVPLPGGEIPTMAQYAKWLHDMRAIVPAKIAS